MLWSSPRLQQAACKKDDRHVLLGVVVAGDAPEGSDAAGMSSEVVAKPLGREQPSPEMQARPSPQGVKE